MKKKGIIAFTAASVAASIVVPVASAAPAFSDVSTTNSHIDAISNLVERGVIKGYEDGTFRPNTTLTRAHAAKILANVLNLDTSSTKQVFKDVSSTSEYVGAINALVNAGIVNGYDDNTYRPNEPLTRGQMAKIIVNAFGLKTDAAGKLPFTDVSKENGYYPYIQALSSFNVTQGTTKTTYSPNDPVKRGQMASFVVRAEKAFEQGTASEEELKVESVSFTIDALKDGAVETSIGNLEFSDDLKILFSARNATVLSNANVKAKVVDNRIVSVYDLTVNTAGTEKTTAVLDGGNATLQGSLKVNADYVEIQKLNVDGNVTVTSKVDKAVAFNGLNIKADLVIEESKETVASLAPIVVAETTNGPKVTLKQSTVNGIQAKRNNISVESDTKIPSVTVSASVKAIQLNADVQQVNVNVDVNIEITGNGNLDEVTVQKAIEIALKVAGEVGTLAINSPDAKVEVGTSLKIDNLQLSENVKTTDVVKNYSEVKEKISSVVDSKGSTVESNSSSSKNSSGGSSKSSSSRDKEKDTSNSKESNYSKDNNGNHEETTGDSASVEDNTDSDNNKEEPVISESQKLANEYNERHHEILNKPLDEITDKDDQAIYAAYKEYQYLSGEVQELLGLENERLELIKEAFEAQRTPFGISYMRHENDIFEITIHFDEEFENATLTRLGTDYDIPFASTTTDSVTFSMDQTGLKGNTFILDVDGEQYKITFDNDMMVTFKKYKPLTNEQIAELFKEKHSAILNKQPEDIKQRDEEAIYAAFREFNQYTEEIQAVLMDEHNKLIDLNTALTEALPPIGIAISTSGDVAEVTLVFYEDNAQLMELSNVSKREMIEYEVLEWNAIKFVDSIENLKADTYEFTVYDDNFELTFDDNLRAYVENMDAREKPAEEPEVTEPDDTETVDEELSNEAPFTITVNDNQEVVLTFTESQPGLEIVGLYGVGFTTNEFDTIAATSFEVDGANPVFTFKPNEEFTETLYYYVLLNNGVGYEFDVEKGENGEYTSEIFQTTNKFSILTELASIDISNDEAFIEAATMQEELTAVENYFETIFRDKYNVSEDVIVSYSITDELDGITDVVITFSDEQELRTALPISKFVEVERS